MGRQSGNSLIPSLQSPDISIIIMAELSINFLTLIVKKCLDIPDIMTEYSPMKPIPVPIPLDLAEALEIHPSNLSHVNAGRRRLPIDKCIRLLEIAETDPRLTGLCFIHLRPELKPAVPWLCKKKGR
jgi:hypothetical protein